MIPDLQESLNQLQEFLRGCDRRIMILVEGDAQWTLETVQNALSGLAADPVLWFSERAPEGAWTLPASRLNHELGREANHAVFDIYSGFNPDALAVISGNIRGGGCLWVLCPPLSLWQSTPDPYVHKIAVEPWGVSEVKNTFLARVAWLLQQYPDKARLQQSDGLHVPDLPDYEVQPRRPDDLGCLTQCQRSAVDAVLHVMTGHRKRPLVIEADRGRGKSVAMGLAVAQLQRDNKRILITAPRPENAETTLRFACTEDTQAKTVEFYAPDRLLNDLPAADLLLVDEAAAIAPELLKRMLANYSRTVMATTVNGYEGTGRGFSTRFQAYLDQHYPGWVKQSLAEPVRWQAQDWLEELQQQLLLLKPHSMEDAADYSSQLLKFEEFGYQCDVESESRLNQIFELLVSAHYRTRPSDLRSLLDGSNIRLFVLMHLEQVVAVAMVAREGDLVGELAEQILQGKRRPHGQVLPQSLAVHMGQAQALAMRHWRVVRIAVQPEQQGAGLGTKLLDCLRQQAGDEGIDGIGSLFSGTSGVLRFWQKNDFTALRIGYQRESTTGAYSVLIYRGINSAGQTLEKDALNRIQEDLPLQLTHTHSQLAPDLVLTLCHKMDATIFSYERDQSALQQFLAGYTPYENVVAGLWRIIWSCHMQGSPWNDLPELERHLVVMKVLQNQSWEACISILALTGKKQARAVLRQAIARWTRHSSLLNG